MKACLAPALGLLLALSIQSNAAPTVVTYAAPAGIPSTSDFAVSVEGFSSFVYTATNVGKYTIFSFGNGPVHVRITTATVINTVDVRPMSLDIQPTLTTNTIDFDLAAPANISVEVNGDTANPLFVFANPLEVTIPTPGDPNVIFFAAGQVHNSNEIVVPSGKTVYIEGGAYVNGRIRIGSDIPGGSGSSNVTVLGRGVMDATSLASVRPARVFNSSSATFDGPVFLGSDNFGVAAFASTNLTFKNIKILNKELFGDGLDIVGCSNVTIDGCFIRSGDDTIALKTAKFGWTNFVDTVTVTDCVLWNGGYGKALQIGFETDAQYIRNVTFRNSDIIHKSAADPSNATLRAAISIDTSQAVVSNVRYEDIRVEDCTQNYIVFNLGGATEIRDVYLKNVSFSGAANALPIRLNGWDSTHQISNVTFDNLTFTNGPVTNRSQVSLISDNTSNISFMVEAWTNASGGTWLNPSNWSWGTIASGVDHVADFSTLNLTADRTVTLDAARTVGALIFRDTPPSHDWTLAPGTGGSLTLAVSRGAPAISVLNQSATISAVIAGSQGFQKSGAGSLTLTGSNTYNGVTIIDSGSGLVTVSGNQSAASGGWVIGSNSTAATTVTFATGSQVSVAASNELRIGNTIVGGNLNQTLNVDGTVVSAGQLTVGRPGILNLNAGSIWNQGGPMSVAAQGGFAAKLNVAGGSAFTYSGSSTIKVNGSQGNSGQGLLGIDGSFTTSAGFEQTTVPSSGFGRVTLQNGGVLKLSANVPALSLGVQFVLGTNGGAIDTDVYSATLAAGITGTNGLAKRGAGTLTLAGTNAYTGATIIEAGTLAVNGSLGNTAVEVKNASTLSLSGDVGGSITVRTNGRIGFALAAAPGAQPARTIGGTLTFDAGSIVNLSAASLPGTGAYVLANASAISGVPGGVSLSAGLAGSVSVQGASLRLTVTAVGYNAWVGGYNLATKTAPNDDPDGDGISNGLEFATGTDPSLSNPLALQAQIIGTNFVVTFSRADVAEFAGAQLFVVAGESLQSPSQVFTVGDTTANSSAGVSVVENGSALDNITVTIPIAGRASLFARLKVVIPP